MKAAQITGYGGAEVMQIVDDAPKPTHGSDEVLIEVHGAGVNPFDWKVREGYVRQVTELSFPAILGGDFAGIVAAVGEGVTNIHPGDAVYGQANPLSGHGSYAEYTVAKAGSLGPKPADLDFIQAAAAPLTAVSAYQALVEHLELQPGQKILIHGGAGGIGSFAIQLAKHLGAHVAVTATGNGVPFVKQLGADEVIDYRTQPFAELLHGFDAVFDLAGGEAYKASFKVLTRGGILVSMAEQPDEALAAQYGVTSINQFTRVTTERLKKVAELLEQGALTVHVDKVFPLDQAADALEYLHAGGRRGRVVLNVHS